MFKLNKKTEYALLALRFMSRHMPGPVASVKEVATHYAIPEMLLAKVMQKLKRQGIILSVKGSSGGYALARPLADISFAAVLDAFDENMALVECIAHADDAADCQQGSQCDIRSPIRVLHEAIMAQLEGLTVADLFEEEVRSRPRHLSIYR